MRIKILKLENGKRKKVIITALMGKPEFEQLLGGIEHLSVFSCKTLNEKATVTMTGRRSSAAKWFLFPSALRKQLPLAQYDRESITCGTLIHGDTLFVIYRVPKLL